MIDRLDGSCLSWQISIPWSLRRIQHSLYRQLGPPAELQSAASLLRKNMSYVFVLFCVVWLAVAYLAASWLVLWPAVACGAGGALLKLRPGRRLTNAWAPSAALLGFVLSAYQVYATVPLLSGAFVTVAGASAAIFTILAVAHAYLAYASYSGAAVK